jgi:endoglucanase
MHKKLQLLLTILAVCSLHGHAQSVNADTDGSNGRSQQEVGVEGTHLTMNGQPWHSRGVSLQGFVRPLSLLNCEHKAHPDNKIVERMLNSRDAYGPAELEHIRAFHANTIRFVVSQPGLDPGSGDDADSCPLYSPTYLDELVHAVQTARRAGFVVMLMMQDEQETGDLKKGALPTDETLSDWELLIAVFGGDRGVVFDLYNEPGLLASPSSWKLWLNGGEFDGASYLGMQTLVDHLRRHGSENVFVLDGLATEVPIPGTNKTKREAAETLENVPPVADPRNRIVYAVHPYLHGMTDESHWEEDFGTPSKTIPVWADEWSAPTDISLGLGSLQSYQPAVDLLNFLREHSIPLCTGAFDVPRWVVEDVPGWTLTIYKDSGTGKIEGSSGTLVYHDFVDDYSRPLTAADGK